MQPQPIPVAPFQTGLMRDVSDWLAPMDSFSDCNNFHIHHTKLIKRDGYRVFGTLQKTDSTKTITDITTAADAEVTTSTNHGYTTGDRVYITGVVTMTEVNDKIFTITVTALDKFTIGFTTTNAYGGGGTAAKIIPDTDRVMGIYRYLNSSGVYEGLAFNTTRANKFNTSVSQNYEPLDSAAIMSGGVYDYIWAHLWQSSGIDNRLYFTNGKAYNAGLDGIRYYDASGTGNLTTSFIPSLGGTNVLYGGKLIFSLKQRLIILNTYEYDGSLTNNHPQRARWCQAQGPSNWDETVAGGGGYVDAPTGDQILSAGSLQDAIIVLFTNSVWMLRPTSDPALPFRWDKINDFRACNGKMATQEYDKHVVAFGFRGITATDGVQTQRVDDRIINFVTDDINAEEFGKVYCQRDYDNQRFWTLYPYNESTENNKALIFDDDSKSFTEYEISLNCLGYGNYYIDYGLDDFTSSNDLDFSLEEMGNETLQDYFWNEDQDAFLGGDISGTVYALNVTASDDGDAISANVTTNMWNPYLKEGDEARLAYVDILVETDETTQMTVDFYKDTNDAPYASQTSDILPPLGYIASIINITNASPAQVTAADHGLATGDVIFIYGVQGMDDVNDEYTITYVDENNFTLDGVDSTLFDPYVAGGQIVSNRYYRTKAWKRFIAGGVGNLHQMRISTTGTNSPLTIEEFVPYFKKTGKRLIN